MAASSPSAEELEPRIAERLANAGYELPEASVRSLSVHLAMTLKWAQAISLTSITSMDEAIDRHVLESVIAAAHVDATRGRLVDVGSGNGYPALPIAVLHPQLGGTLLEPHLRRSVFLGQVIDSLGLAGIAVRRSRIEAPEDFAPFGPLGTITMRAVAIIETVLAAAPTALAPGGRLLLFLNEEAQRKVVGGTPAGLRLLRQAPLPHRRSTRLVVFERVSSAP